jgi:hypothetical protein
LANVTAVILAASSVLGSPWVTAALAHKSRSHQAKPLTLRPSFKRAGTAASLIAGEGYLFEASSLATAATGELGTLLSERTGATINLSLPSCTPNQFSAPVQDPVALGLPRIDGPSLAFECSETEQPQPELYSLASATWTSVTPAPSILDACAETGPGQQMCEGDTSTVAAGSHWLEYQSDVCPVGDEHCATSQEFQNLSTGVVAGDPTGGKTIADLNSPTLASHVCSPLAVPAGEEQGNEQQAPGSLTFYGRFAIAWGAADGSSYTLERCGTRKRRALPSAPAANPHEVIWSAGHRRLAGVFLPSLRSFAVKLPARVGNVGQVALGLHTLYVLSNGKVWAAPIRTKP